MWNITKEQLYEDSKKNTPKLLKAGIVEMKEVMRSALKEDIINRYRMTGAESEDGEFDEKMADEMTEQMISYMFEAKGSIPMYVLTNRNKTFGASCIWYGKVLQEFARRLDKNLYILPSSIHEVIIVTEDEDYAEVCDELAAYMSRADHIDPVDARRRMNGRKQHFYMTLEQLVHAHPKEDENGTYC